MPDNRSISYLTTEAGRGVRPPVPISLEDVVAAALAPEWRRPAPLEPAFTHADGTRLLVGHFAARTSRFTRKPSGAQWLVARRDEEARPGGAEIQVLGHHPVWASGDRDPSRWRFYVIAAKMLPPQGALSLPAAAFLAQPVAPSGLLDAANRLRRPLRP